MRVPTDFSIMCLKETTENLFPKKFLISTRLKRERKKILNIFFPSGLRHGPRNFDLQDECFGFLPDPFPQAILSVNPIYLWLQRVTEWPFQDFCCVMVPRPTYILNPCIWTPSRFPQMRPTLLLLPNFSQCSCVKSEAERGKQIKELGHLHVTPHHGLWYVWFPFSHHNDQLFGDRDSSYIPQTLGIRHKFKMCAK